MLFLMSDSVKCSVFVVFKGEMLGIDKHCIAISEHDLPGAPYCMYVRMRTCNKTPRVTNGRLCYVKSTFKVLISYNWRRENPEQCLMKQIGSFWDL